MKLAVFNENLTLVSGGRYEEIFHSVCYFINFIDGGIM
jgi:hypothetical protein